MTIKSLQAIVDRLNDITNNPRHYIIQKDEEVEGGGAYYLIEGNDRCLVGNGAYHIESMGKSYKLSRASTQPGCTGTSNVSSGYVSAKVLEAWIWTFMQGIEIGKKLHKVG
jgi:hypothetical protein